MTFSVFFILQTPTPSHENINTSEDEHDDHPSAPSSPAAHPPRTSTTAATAFKRAPKKTVKSALLKRTNRMAGTQALQEKVQRLAEKEEDPKAVFQRWMTVEALRFKDDLWDSYQDEAYQLITKYKRLTKGEPLALQLSSIQRFAPWQPQPQQQQQTPYAQRQLVETDFNFPSLVPDYPSGSSTSAPMPASTSQPTAACSDHSSLYSHISPSQDSANERQIIKCE